MKLYGPVANAVQPEMMPQVIIMRAIPNARADLLEDDVAGDLEEDIAPEERAGRHAVPRRVEADVLVHRQRREADIDAIEVAEKIREDRKRQDPQVHLAYRRLFDRFCHIIL